MKALRVSSRLLESRLVREVLCKFNTVVTLFLPHSIGSKTFSTRKKEQTKRNLADKKGLRIMKKWKDWRSCQSSLISDESDFEYSVSQTFNLRDAMPLGIRFLSCLSTPSTCFSALEDSSFKGICIRCRDPPLDVLLSSQTTTATVACLCSSFLQGSFHNVLYWSMCNCFLFCSHFILSHPSFSFVFFIPYQFCLQVVTYRISRSQASQLSTVFQSITFSYQLITLS